MSRFVLVSGDFVERGGMDRPNFELARHLARVATEVHLVAHRVSDRLLRLSSVIAHRQPRPGGLHVLGEPLLDHAGRRWIERIRRGGGTAIANGGNCLGAQVNWVHFVHAAWTPRPGGSVLARWKARVAHLWWKRQERRALRSARLVIANSERSRRDVIHRIGVDPQRVKTVYYGIDADEFHPLEPAERATVRANLDLAHGQPAAIFVGALGDRRKGFDTLFQAWLRLAEDPEFDAVLVIAGAGRELEHWRALAARSARPDRFRFLGFREDIARVIASCDAIVAPTRYEAYGLGVHEALCCGLAPIVSRTAGVAEQIDGASADLLLDDPEDAQALARTIGVWLDGRAAYAADAARIGARLRERTWEVMAAEFVALLSEDAP